MNHKESCSDDCDLDHCPKCGGHVMEYLESFQMCDQCQMDEEYNSNLNKLVCDINYREKSVRAFRNGKLIAEVSNGKYNGVPMLTLFHMIYDVSDISISLDDLAIIMESWKIVTHESAERSFYD